MPTRVDEKLPMSDWDRFVNSNENGSIFHTSMWREALKRGALESLYLSATNSGGDVIAVYPFFIVKVARGLGGALVSLPDSDIGGAVVSPGEPAGAILSLFGNYLKRVRLRKRFVLVRSNGLEDPGSSTIPLGEPEITCTGGFFHLDLKENPPASIWDSLFSDQGGQRKKIRRLEKEGFSSSLASSASDFRLFCALHNRTIQNAGGALHSQQFLSSIWSGMYPKYFNVVLVRRGEEIVAGLGFLCHPERKSIHIMYGAYDSELSEKWVARSVYLFAHWKVLVWAAENGYARVNFGTTPADPSHSNYKFKSQFGGRFVKKYQVKIRLLGVAGHPLVRKVARIFD